MRTDWLSLFSSATRLPACMAADSPTPYAAPISLGSSPARRNAVDLRALDIGIFGSHGVMSSAYQSRRAPGQEASSGDSFRYGLDSNDFTLLGRFDPHGNDPNDTLSLRL